MGTAARGTVPTPEERLWTTDPTTPAIVLAKLARFPDLQQQVRNHPAAYPALVAWIDKQTADPEVAPPPAATASGSRRGPLVIAVGVAATTLLSAGITLGVVQPWASVSDDAQAVAATPTSATPTPTPTPSPTPTSVPAAPVPGTVVVRAGANLRAGPSTSSAKIGAYGNGAVVQIACYVRGDTISDALGTTDVWYAVGDGYISAAILQASDASAVVPCDQ
jgi:hypothetical protein